MGRHEDEFRKMERQNKVMIGLGLASAILVIVMIAAIWILYLN